MHRINIHLFAFLLCLLCVGTASAQDDNALAPVESDYYNIITLPLPEGLMMEVGGLVCLPNNKLAASTRRGEVWVVENPYMLNERNPVYKRFASGMHEILGLAYRDNALYAAQRGELTKLVDENGDGKADLYEAVYVWPLSGHYHEYSFGPKIDANGDMYVTANVAFGEVEWWRGESRVPWRGWTMKITPDGQMEPYATGMRSPCGIGLYNNEFFYADNQGDWMGSGGLVHVEKGDFTGHPAGLRWAGLPNSPVKVRTNDVYYRVNPRFAAKGQVANKPEDIADEKPTPLYAVAKEVPGVKTPAVWLPHGVLGISTSEIIVDTTGGKFGPFSGQMFIGDQGQSKIVRVALEKVKGSYQGVAFGFVEGFQSGVLRMCWGHDGSMFVGETNRGWGSAGTKDYGLQRLAWTGKIPFEMKTVKAMPDGFEIEFTQPVDKKTAQDPASYQVTSFIYKYHPVYGSPAVNDKDCRVKGVVVSRDGLKARIVVDNLREKYIHEINATGVRSYQDNFGLLHPAAYYTLNNIPEGEKLNLPEPPPPPKEPKAAAPAAHHNHGMTMVSPDAKQQPAAAAPAKKKSTAPKSTKTKKAASPKVVAGRKRVTKKPASWTKIDKSVVLSTLPGLKYDQKTITIKAGSRVKLSFYNNDDMPHNVVITQPNQADNVGQLAMKLGIKGTAKSHIPNTNKVLFHTRLLPPGTSESIFFVAPKKPGVYTYVCTVPGHHSVMRGSLRVVP
ncbi:MAG: plastocyanin/azurin family copper-binding protein [Bacteroidota bacterium]